MAARAADAGPATRETARLGVSTAVEGVVSGVIDIGAATVAPLCIALLKVKGVVDGASRNREELARLCEMCESITVQVVDKAKASKTSTIDVKPRQECIHKVEEVAERYHDRGCLARLAQFRRDGDDIQRLRKRINDVVRIMGLSGVVNNGDKLDHMLDLVRAIPVRSVPGCKLCMHT